MEIDELVAQVKASMDSGHYALALDILDNSEKYLSASHKLQYLQALALSRSGCTRRASFVLQKFLENTELAGVDRMDAMALSGKLEKQNYKYLSGNDARQAAKRSADQYKAAFELRPHYYPAINAASMYLLAEDRARSKNFAECAHNLCVDKTNDIWALATKGEAALLLRNIDAARKCYSKAVNLAKRNWGVISSMRSQVLMLSNKIEVEDILEEILVVPKVVLFSGHMIDREESSVERFPSVLDGVVKEELVRVLRKIGAGFGYGSAACGGDIIFAESMEEINAETNIYLPFAEHDFVQSSIAFAGEEWVCRFNEVLKKSSRTFFVTEERYGGDDILFQYLNQIMLGASLARAEELETEVVGVALIDSASERLAGGTTNAVQSWRQLGIEVEQLDLARIRRQYHQTGVARNTKKRAIADEGLVGGEMLHMFKRRISTMLFADMTGFSKIQEQFTPNFIQYFLGAIAELIDDMEPTPAFVNTWGDGLFVVFEKIESAARLALRIRDSVAEKDWRSVGLPGRTNVRIALHSGPVYSGIDPLLKEINYYGSHVTTAARIEPITVPGAVYLTEQAAALLKVSNSPDLMCEKIGRLQLAKSFGEQSLYVLQWAASFRGEVS